MTQRDRLIERLKDQAVELGLTLVHSKAGFLSGERFAILQGRMCLIASDDPSNIEQYLFGYRDGLTVRTVKGE
jgi:hypothetical protein